MALDDIRKNLEQRFFEPLPEFYDRRIIVWYDEGKEFIDEIEDFALCNAKVCILRENNHFACKKLLSHDDLTSNYLLYVPFNDSLENDWLLDIKLYSEEFRADQLSIWMREMNIKSKSELRDALKDYRDFLKSAQRRSLLAKFGSRIDNANKLRLSILASVCKLSDWDPKMIIRAVINSGDGLSMLDYGVSGTFFNLVNKMTGYAYESAGNIDEMTRHIVLSSLTKTMDEKVLEGLEGHYNSFKNGYCFDLMYEWLHSDRRDELKGILLNIEMFLQLHSRFEQAQISDLEDTEILPVIDEIIITKLMNQVNEGVVNVDEIFAVVAKRRTMVWYDDFSVYYDALLQVANMYKFYNDHQEGFHYGRASNLWKAYTDSLYLMDTYYRKFHYAFKNSLIEVNSYIDDMFKKVVDVIEGLYKNWFLESLGENWTNVISDDLRDYGMISNIDQQVNFYSNEIENTNNRVYVIVSDALRYEVAASIVEKLKSGKTADIELNSREALFPTITKFGMAALLPHKKLSVEIKKGAIKVLCDGHYTEANDREEILNSYNPNSLVVKYNDFVALRRDEQRELCKGKEVVYIYHDTIDSCSHHSEQDVFDACEKTCVEIVNLINILTSSLSVGNIVVTSDHGFLYTYDKLDEDDKMERSAFRDSIIEQGRRYVFMDENSNPNYLLPVKTFYCEEGMKAYTPRENIRIKGSGSTNFAHGGASLQEMVVPVINYRHLRNSYKQYVDNKDKYDLTPVTLSLLSYSHKISNMIFNLSFYQKEPVKGNYIPCTYLVYLQDRYGNTISDVQKIIADRTSESNKDREYRCTFNLKQQKYNQQDIYYLVIKDENKKSTQMPIKEEFTIDISMSFDDFDFF